MSTVSYSGLPCAYLLFKSDKRQMANPPGSSEDSIGVQTHNIWTTSKTFHVPEALAYWATRSSNLYHKVTYTPTQLGKYYHGIGTRLKRVVLLGVWFGLCCLMTPGLSKDIQCHVWPYFLEARANQQIRHQATHKVGCQPGDFAYCHFNLPPGFVWVYMG